MLAGTAAGCTGPGPAPRAGEQACTTALAAAPQDVLGQSRSPIDVRGALAWGAPPIVLRCGLPPLAPTTARCLDVNGQDWVVTDLDADPAVFTSFGTDPAVEVSVPRAYGQQPGALVALAPVAASLPRNDRSCD